MSMFFNKQTDFINETIENRIETNYDPFSRFLGKSHVTVTYYKQDKIESTFDVAHGTRDSKIGETSPIKYKKIYGVPIFIDQNALDYDFDDENGITVGWNSEGVMLPNVIEPTADDLIVFEYKDKNFQHKQLFKITSAISDYIKSNSYFKIEFKYDKEFPDELEKQVVETYRCIFDNVGTDRKCIVKEEDYINLDNLFQIKEELSQKIKNAFFVNRASTFAISDNGKVIYDPYAIEFIVNNKLFNDITVLHSIPGSYLNNFDIKYNFTIFKILEKRHLKEWNTTISLFKSMYTNNYFACKGIQLNTIDYYVERVNTKDLFTDIVNIFTFTYENIKDETCTDPIVILLRNYFNNESNKSIQILLDDDMIVYNDLLGFYENIIILFILNSVINDMTKKEKDIFMN